MSFKRQRAYFCASILTTMVCILLRRSVVHAQPMLAGCGPGTAAAEGPSQPIPNDPQGRKGWLDEVQTDDAGNILEVWCIEIAGGVGNSYGYRYIPAGGGAPRWIGRCAFEVGQNTDTKEPTGDANQNGIPDGWKKVTWTSEDDAGDGGAGDDDGQVGTKDWDWEYTVGTGNLRKWETNNGDRVNPENPDFDGPAPQDFDGLFPAPPPDNPQQSDDMRQEPPVKVKLVSHVGSTWNYELRGNELIQFSHTTVLTNDKWSLAAAGITGAQAPSSWVVTFDSGYVTWTYAGIPPLDLSASPVTGFSITSTRPLGLVFWLSDSVDDDLANFGFAGSVNGPSAPASIPTLSSAGLLLVVICILVSGYILLRRVRTVRMQV